MGYSVNGIQILNNFKFLNKEIKNIKKFKKKIRIRINLLPRKNWG